MKMLPHRMNKTSETSEHKKQNMYSILSRTLFRPDDFIKN